ncbi:MAG TPA: hypothetical protein VNY74_15370 [Edaphobacter sp.]|jgi:hypothetical protein|nr:hypothetical protein [Edaphobacter sp.]
MDWKSAKIREDGSVVVPERWLHLHYYEALNILFRMENALRVFVYVVLKNKLREKWTETTLQTIDDEQSSIAVIAAKRIAQAKGHGYSTSQLAGFAFGILIRRIFVARSLASLARRPRKNPSCSNAQKK